MLLIAVAFAALVAQFGPHAARRGARRARRAIAVPATVAAALLVGVAASIALGGHGGPADRPVHHRGTSGRGAAMSAELRAAPGIRRGRSPTWPRNSWPPDFGWRWWRPTTTATGCGWCTCSSPAGPDRRIELECIVPASDPAVPSLAYLSFPASRFEREMADLYGIRPIGHPRPRRLVRHAHWPEDWYPMREDAGPAPEFAPTGRFPFVTVEGTGVYEIPVGPVHAGLIEPGHFRFSVVGETVLRLKARLWFVHRGLEKLFHGRPATGATELAERVSGDTSAGHAVAHSLAVEDALGVEVPDAVHRLRALLVELERLYNLAADLGALANDVGFSLANSHCLRIREQLLRLNATVTGHRLLRGAIAPGRGRAARSARRRRRCGRSPPTSPRSPN